MAAAAAPAPTCAPASVTPTVSAKHRSASRTAGSGISSKDSVETNAAIGSDGFGGRWRCSDMYTPTAQSGLEVPPFPGDLILGSTSTVHMRRTTRDLSTSEIAELATAFGIGVGDSELDDLKRRVNRRLDGLDEVYEIPIDAPNAPGERRWSKPTAEFDPYNAIATICEVAPTDGGRCRGSRSG